MGRYMLQVFAFIVLLQTVSAITTYYMNDKCGDYIDVGFYDEVRVKLVRSTSTTHRTSCQLTVTTNYNKRLMVYFKSINIYDSSVYCSNNFLELNDGASTSSPCLILGSCRRCGYSAPSGVYTTSGSNLLLEYGSSSSYSSDNFDLVITSYHTGYCNYGEYNCNNGRCIDKSLTCNGYNPCGDYSDCDVVLTVGGIVGVVIGGAVFITIVLIVIVICRRRRRTIIVERTTHTSVPVTATVNTTSYGYNQPVPSQYPAPVPPQYPQAGQPPNYPGKNPQAAYQNY